MELNQVCELFQRTIQNIYTLYAADILNTNLNGAAIGVQESNNLLWQRVADRALQFSVLIFCVSHTAENPSARHWHPS